MIELERRPEPSRCLRLASPLLALAATAAVGAVLFMLLGIEPLHGLAVFFIEPLNGAFEQSELALKATPLLLIALGLAMCFRAQVWNIGAEGQFVAGAVAAGGVAMLADDHTGRWIVAAILLAGVAGGALWAALVALLRDRAQASEVLVSLMLVYIAELALSALVYGPWKDPGGYNFPQTVAFAAPTRIPRLFTGLRVDLGAVLALLSAGAFWLWLFRSRAGFALQVGGLAPAAARYAGYSPRKALWTALLVSGAMAGLAGALAAAGPLGRLTPQVSAGDGFAAIVVAFVGRLHPGGIVPAALLVSLLDLGGELAQSRLGLPKSLSMVFQASMLLAVLACDALTAYRPRWRVAPAQPKTPVRT